MDKIEEQDLQEFLAEFKPENKKDKAIQKEEYQEGLYFGMPEEEYHKIPYFSRSLADEMIVDVEEFWYKSPMNPDRPQREETEAMKLGTAIHSMILEPGTFSEKYCKKPVYEDYPNKTILITSDDIKEFLTSIGEKKTGNKPELIERALPYIDPKTYIIWDSHIAEWTQNLDGQRIITGEMAEILEGIKAGIDRRPKIKQLLENTVSEITIIWRDPITGIMCKCRLDCARPEAIGEVKSFSIKNRKNIYKAMCDSIVYEKYNLQFYVYHIALKIILEKIKARKAGVFGDVNQDWLKEFIKNPDKQFFFIFARTQAPHQCMAIELQESYASGASSNVYYTQAEMMWNAAIKLYSECCEKFGVNRWINEKEVETLMDEHVPAVMYQGFNS